MRDIIVRVLTLCALEAHMHTTGVRIINIKSDSYLYIYMRKRNRGKILCKHTGWKNLMRKRVTRRFSRISDFICAYLPILLLCIHLLFVYILLYTHGVLLRVGKHCKYVIRAFTRFTATAIMIRLYIDTKLYRSVKICYYNK